MPPDFSHEIKRGFPPRIFCAVVRVIIAFTKAVYLFAFVFQLRIVQCVVAWNSWPGGPAIFDYLSKYAPLQPIFDPLHVQNRTRTPDGSDG